MCPVGAQLIYHLVAQPPPSPVLDGLVATILEMDSIVEVQRQTHEEIEHFERALYSILSKPQPTHESRLQTEHKASQLLDRISSRVVTLSNLYEDQGTRRSELDRLSAPSNPNDLGEFYSRLGKIQEHYVKYPDTIANGFELALAAFMDEGMDEGGEDEYEQAYINPI